MCKKISVGLHWMTEFDWVCYELKTNRMHCSTYWKFAELADKSSPMYIGCGDGVQGFRRETLTAHSKSRCHVVCHTRLLNDQKQKDSPLQKMFLRISQESQARLEKLFNIAHLTYTDRCIKRIYLYSISCVECFY